jgi:hypothetical protein
MNWLAWIFIRIRMENGFEKQEAKKIIDLYTI